MSIKSKIQALITAANTKTGESDATLTDAVQTLVDGYGQGGTTITDGIVVKARNADNQITEVDYYGTSMPYAMFGSTREFETATRYVTTINWMTNAVYIEKFSFTRQAGLTEINTNAIKGLNPDLVPPSAFNSNRYEQRNFSTMPNLVVLSLPEYEGFLNHYDASDCPKLETVYLPKCTQYASYGTVGRGCFKNDTALQTVQLGSVGYSVTFIDVGVFSNCTQTGLTITIYTTGSYADTAVANTRNGATNATIIIKASEATTYGGNSYAAGDTILTSTP